MTTTATGPNGVQMQKLATLLSSITAWQTRCGVSSAADALAFIHCPHFKPKANCPEYPRAVISRTEDGGFQMERIAGGGKNWFRKSGSLMLKIEDRLDDFGDEKDPDVDFHNFTDAVIYGLEDGAGVSDNIPISGLTATMPPARTDDQEVAGTHATVPTYMAEWRIDWDQT